jgi:hypothetical protein
VKSHTQQPGCRQLRLPFDAVFTAVSFDKDSLDKAGFTPARREIIYGLDKTGVEIDGSSSAS